MNEIIRSIESAQLKKDIPQFAVGDTVRVQVKVVEGSRERLQAFEGVVIARSAKRSPFAALPTASASSARSRCTAPVWTASRLSVAARSVARSCTICVSAAARRPRSRKGLNFQAIIRESHLCGSRFL